MSSPQRTTKIMASLPLISWRTTASTRPASTTGSSLFGIFISGLLPSSRMSWRQRWTFSTRMSVREGAIYRKPVEYSRISRPGGREHVSGDLPSEVRIPSDSRLEPPMRVVVIGGYGNFGARVCRALAVSPAMEVVAAGRHPERGQGAFDGLKLQHVRLDHSEHDFPRALARLAPELVIHCAGPFQSQHYRVAFAAMEAGAHYLDLADGRQFVTGFPYYVHPAARAAQRVAISSATSAPALSSAVIDSVGARLSQIEEIQIAIAPGQRAPRGEATIAAVLGYAGRRFKWRSGGAWPPAWGCHGPNPPPFHRPSRPR